MARETYAALQAKIEKEINKLQKKAEVLQTKRRKPVIASIITSMREYDITPEEIAAAFGAGKSVRTASSGGRRKTGAAAPPRQRRQTRRCAQVPSSPDRGDLERPRQGASLARRGRSRGGHARHFSYQRIKPIFQ